MEDLDFDRAADEAWNEFAMRLAEIISVMDETGDLNIGAVTSNSEDRAPFVNISVIGETVTATVSSNAVLGETYQLGIDQLNQMESLGWSPPTAVGPHLSDGFFRQCMTDQIPDLSQQIVTVFREIYGVIHPVFLDADQLAEVLVPVAPKELETLSERRVETLKTTVFWPRTADELAEEVRRLLIDRVGYEPLADAGGDRAIRVGSTAVFVRVLPDASEVLIYAPLVHDVDGRSRAVELLNDINCEAKIGRYFLLKDRVFGSVSVFAQPFIGAHFASALHEMSLVADAIDDELAAKLRGRTTFTEPAD